MNVVTSKQMKEIEHNALQYDLTYQRLMENAGSAAAAFIRRTFNIYGLNCIIFCGTGNNGGDGFVVARKLHENNANVLVVLMDSTPSTAESQAMLDSVRGLEIPVADFSQNQEKVLELLSHADIIVDAIYGAGFRLPLGDLQRSACTAINDAIAAVISLDLPSGIECDTGDCDSDAVNADFTVAFDSLKPCHVIQKSLSLCGVIETCDIGIPDEAKQGLVNYFGVITTEMAFSHLLPRDPNAHKGSCGTLLAVCGSSRYRGAAALSVLGAYRCGAGLVTLASVEAACAATANLVPEAIFLTLPTIRSAVAGEESSYEILLRGSLKSATAALFGCGVGQGAHCDEMLEYLLRNAACPIVIDADGINALAKNIHLLREAKAPVILTPHPGEMSRLCQKSVQEIESDREGTAMSFAKEHGVILVLKGHETIIANGDGGFILNRTGNAALAKAGSGDVLAGMIGAFAAQGIDPFYSAACAVHLHGLAADRASLVKSQYAMLPHELLDHLCAIFSENGR